MVGDSPSTVNLACLEGAAILWKESAESLVAGSMSHAQILPDQRQSDRSHGEITPGAVPWGHPLASVCIERNLNFQPPSATEVEKSYFSAQALENDNDSWSILDGE